MAVEKPLPEEGVDAPETSAVRELLRLVVKAQKARRLYEARNAISDRLQNELFSRLSEHLEQVGSFTLSIREFEIFFGEDIVYESHDRNDSLAFLLFRDGIRRLSFYNGLEPEEIQDFLKCLNRVALLSNEQDDLVTLFWEADFKSIKYHAIEELTAQSEGPSLQEQLASGSLEGQGAGGAPPDSVSLNVEQPIAHLPVEACRLNEDEIETLRAELTKDAEDPFGLAVVELAIDLCLLETSEKERKALAEHLLSIMKRLLAEGELESLTQAAEHLNGLTEMAFRDSEPVRELNNKILEFLSQESQSQLFFDQMESYRSLKPPQVTAYLACLREDALPTLFEWMGRLPSPAHRRAVTQAALVHKEASLQELERHLPPHREALEASLLREVLFLLSHIEEEKSVAMAERLLNSTDPLTRRETMQLLGRFRNGRVSQICLKLLADPDIEVRSTALDTLVRQGRRELARSILEYCLRDDTFHNRGISEKRRVYAAVAKLAHNEALGWFAGQLRASRRGWFTSRKEREACEAIVHGIRMVGTNEAWRLLQELADKGSRPVRAACQKELPDARRR